MTCLGIRGKFVPPLPHYWTQKLDSSFDVVLVERKEVMVHVLAQVRAVVVGGEFASRTLISYDTLLKRGSVKRANVTSIREWWPRDGDMSTGSQGRVAIAMAHVASSPPRQTRSCVSSS